MFPLDSLALFVHSLNGSDVPQNSAIKGQKLGKYIGSSSAFICRKFLPKGFQWYIPLSFRKLPYLLLFVTLSGHANSHEGPPYKILSHESVIELNGYDGSGTDGSGGTETSRDGKQGQNGQSLMLCAPTVILRGYINLSGGDGGIGLVGMSSSPEYGPGGTGGVGGDGGYGGGLSVSCESLILDNATIDCSGGNGGKGGAGGGSNPGPECQRFYDGDGGHGGNGGGGGSVSASSTGASGNASVNLAGGNGGDGGFGGSAGYMPGIPGRGGDAGLKGSSGSQPSTSPFQNISIAASDGTPGPGGASLDCIGQQLNGEDGGYRTPTNDGDGPNVIHCGINTDCYEPHSIDCAINVYGFAVRSSWGACCDGLIGYCNAISYDGQIYTQSRPFHYSLGSGEHAEFQTVSDSAHIAGGGAWAPGFTVYSQLFGWQHVSVYDTTQANDMYLGFAENAASYRTYYSKGIIGAATCVAAPTITHGKAFCGVTPVVGSLQPAAGVQNPTRYSRWYKLDSTLSEMNISINSVSPDIWVNIYHGSCNNPALVETVSPNGTFDPEGNAIIRKNISYPGTECFIEIVSELPVSRFNLSAASGASNDECSSAINIGCGYLVENIPITTYATFSSLTVPPGCTIARDVWYRISVPGDTVDPLIGRKLSITFSDDNWYNVEPGSGAFHEGYVAIYEVPSGLFDCNQINLIDWRYGRINGQFNMTVSTGANRLYYVRVGSNSPSPNQSLSISCFSKLQ